jgi:glyoxylase-like metal-dependent hydrolase (beta-lactamase superfamily II)
MQVAADIFRVPGVVANAYLITQSDGLALVDCGLPYSHRRILAYMRELGFGAGDLSWILLTHADRDHMGGAHDLRQATGATVVASALEAAAMAQARETRRVQLPAGVRAGFEWLTSVVFAAVKPVVADQIMGEGEELPILGGLQVLATPGHTPGHISFYAPLRKVLFAGDSLRSFGGHLRVSSGANTYNESVAQESAWRQLELSPDVVCTGHGPVVKLG